MSTSPLRASKTLGERAEVEQWREGRRDGKAFPWEFVVRDQTKAKPSAQENSSAHQRQCWGFPLQTSSLVLIAEVERLCVHRKHPHAQPDSSQQIQSISLTQSRTFFIFCFEGNVRLFLVLFFVLFVFVFPFRISEEE